MTNFEKHIKKATSNVVLSDAEKARMKNVLQGYMRFHPAPEPITTYTVTRDWFIFLQRPIAASLVLVLVVGSGVSYAAEGALPGDTLYTIKTSVNEPLKVALASSAEEEAEVEIELAERRIQEAAELAADDRLDEATEAQLAVALDAHAASAATLVEEIDEEDANTAVALSARFETRLRAREDVFARVRQRMENESETSVQRSIREASSRVALLRERTEVRLALAPALGGNPEEVFEPAAATMAMKAAPAAFTAESANMAETFDAPFEAATPMAESVPESAVERNTAEHMQKAAEYKLKETQKKARKSDAARAELEIAENLLEEGEDLLETENYAAAFFSFRASLEQSERTSVFFDSETILEKARVKHEKSNESEERDEDSSNSGSNNKDESRGKDESGRDD